MFIMVDCEDSDAGLVIDPPHGGKVMFGPGEKHVTVGPWKPSKTDLLLGPLTVDVVDSGQLLYDKFEFQYKSGSVIDDGLFGALGASLPPAAAAESGDEEGKMSRRRLLTSIAAAVGGGVLASTATAQSQTVEVVTGEIGVNDGHELRLRDSVANVLPVGQEYLVLVDNVQVGTLTPDSPSVTVGRGRTGEFSILTEDNMSVLQSLFAEDLEEQEFIHSLPAAANSFDQGEKVTVTTDATTVNALNQQGPDRTAVTLGRQSLPAESESTDDVAGYWTVTDDELVYVTGPSPPSTADVTIRTGIGRVDELQDDIRRLTQ